MDTLDYKGYVIRAQPQPVKDSDDWTVQIHIERKGPAGLKVRQFRANNRIESKEEAIAHCYELGKQIIDGRIEGYTVDDL